MVDFNGPAISTIKRRLTGNHLLDAVVLQVRDRGIGISRQDLDKIFMRFYRSESSVSSDSGGSGLGLTIIQHIAEAHGGRVEVKSEPEKGSDFSVRLPLAPSREEQ